MILLPNKSLDEVLQWADIIRTEIAQLEMSSLSVPGSQTITLSLGVSCQVPDPQLEPKTLVNQADKALQNAIEQGRDRVVIFS